MAQHQAGQGLTQASTHQVPCPEHRHSCAEGALSLVAGAVGPREEAAVTPDSLGCRQTPTGSPWDAEPGPSEHQGDGPVPRPRSAFPPAWPWQGPLLSVPRFPRSSPPSCAGPGTEQRLCVGRPSPLCF